MVDGETNVRSIRFGRGAANGIGDLLGRFVVTTMPVPWEVAGARIRGTPLAVLMVESMELDELEAQVARAPRCDTVVAVGGGQAIDLGKFLAWKRGCRLVTVPTIISVDAFVTPSAAVRRNHRVEYVGKATPDPLIIDFELIRTAPAELNIAGVGDLLSIHTATHDWELAHQAGKDEQKYSPVDAERARAILGEVEAYADRIAMVTDDGLRAIVDGYIRVNTICLPAGHYRAEEGSEHYLFYELEERLGRSFIHGHIIGLGIYLLSRLQDNRAEWITGLMDRLKLRYQPVDLGIDRETLTASLLALRDYTERRGLWYTVIQERPITPEWIEGALAGLIFKK